MSLKTVWFDDAEDEYRLSLLRDAAEKAKARREGVVRSLDEDDPYVEAARAHDKFADEMQERRIRVVVRHFESSEWRRLLNANPPRENNDEDEMFGVNVEALAWQAIPRAIVRSLSENLPDDVEAWMKTLSDAQLYGRDLAAIDGLFLAVWAANNGKVQLADPTQRLASDVSPRSAATSS